MDTPTESNTIEVRDFYIAWLDAMNEELAAIDTDYFDTPGKKAINRINNNLMFQPSRPVYKNHFGAGLDQISKQGDFYIHIGERRELYWWRVLASLVQRC